MVFRHADRLRCRPRRFHILWLTASLIVAGFSLLPARVTAASFTASLDRDTITFGESASLSLTFEGGSSQNQPELPNVPGLQITYVGPSSQFSFINGQTSSTVTHHFTVTPRTTGTFTIPALTVEVNGQRLTSQPLTLTVLKADTPTAAAINSGNQIVFMKLSLPEKEIYAGQMLVAQLQICVRDDVQNFGNFQFTGQPADGFSVGKMSQGQQQRAQIGNHLYTVIPLSFALTAVKSGTLSLGPFTASATYVVPSANQAGGDPFFRQFFNQGEQRQISLATDTLTVESHPLPVAGRPANFGGAIGDFTLTASIGPTNLTVGDPVTVRVQIAGRGALDAIQLPDLSSLKNFKIFPPTAKTEITDQLGLEGKKSFEEIVTPENPEVREWPAFSFSFFNPRDGRYHTLTQPAVPLTVKAAAATPMPALASVQNSAPENQSAQDILPIKDRLGTLESNRRPLVVQPGFLALQSVPLLAFIAALVWRKRTDSLANNPRLRRQRAVAQLIRDGLSDLKKHATANQPDEFFALLFRLLQEQLGERLDCPASAITENVIEEHAALRGAPNETLDSLRELFQLCNQARYAPVRGTSELNSVAAKLEKTLGELQEVKA
jgi:hypothetical protein